MPMSRRGRPGLLGTMARTAVVAGTANMTVNAMNRNSQQRAAEKQAYATQQAQQQAQQAQQVAYAPPPQAAPAPPAPPAPPAAAPQDDLIARLTQLGELHTSGILSDEEFAAAKSKLLG